MKEKPKNYAKVKLKFTPEQAMNDQPGVKIYSTLSLTSALDGGRCPTPSQGRFTLGKVTPYPSYRRLRGPHRAGLDGCGISRPHRDSIPGQSIP
jgi:hypothetical protein